MAITVSIPKAKDVHKEHLRADRKPKLEALDVLFIRAQEAGSDTTDIVSKKQQLRATSPYSIQIPRWYNQE